jgi:hypothetical protein
MERLFPIDPTGLAAAVHGRRLYKRALELPASDVPAGAQPWLWEDPDLLERVEDACADRVGLAVDELLIDFPARSSMLAVELPLRTRGGGVERLTSQGRQGQLGLPRVADELYQSARRFRVFVARPPTHDVTPILQLTEMTAIQIRDRLDRGTIF